MDEQKYYSLGTWNNEQWIEVHQGLVDGSLLGREVECCDHKDHSPTRGDFILTDAEAQTLQADARIRFINLTIARYPEIYNATEDDLTADVKNLPYNRYDSSVENWQNWYNGGTFGTGWSQSSPASSTLGRASSQLLRMGQYNNPWNQPYTDTYGAASPTYSEIDSISDNPVQKGAGEHVDVIVADNGSWIVHVEFINPNRASGLNSVSPSDYIGGNPISDVGFCDVLDVCLDGPYYIDPDWFNADASRLTTRFDGTVTAEESAARLWWSDSSARSAKFANAGTTVPIFSGYTRANVHGDGGYPLGASANHGTQCASLCYGRTHGWAYNCNKWHLNLYGTYNLSRAAGGNSASIEVGFDLIKIFHQNKPINRIYGTRDPTLMSNSWGFRFNKSSSYYYYRSSTGTAYGGQFSEPEFMKYMGESGDLGRWKSEFYDSSMTVAGDELVESGVIFVVAAGNSSQTQVNPDDPEYDNHISDGASDGVYSDAGGEVFGFLATGTTNRRGFPQHIGKTESQTFAGNTTVKFPAIIVGALDDNFGTNYRERKANYSDMGNAIDLYAPADGTLAANKHRVPGNIYRQERYDNSYDNTNPQYGFADVYFNGTSAACPIACGFLATIVQYNRSWTYEDIRNWLTTSVTPQVTSVDNATAYPQFYDAARGTTASSSSWSDTNGLQGGTARVLYLADYPATTPYPGGAGFRGGFTLKKCGFRRKTE